MKKGVCVVALIVAVIGIAMFISGACFGTIEGYKGADGKYYSNPDAKGSLEWMCTPGLIMGVVGGIVFLGTIDSLSGKKGNSEKQQEENRDNDLNK